RLGRGGGRRPVHGGREQPHRCRRGPGSATARLDRPRAVARRLRPECPVRPGPDRRRSGRRVAEPSPAGRDGRVAVHRGGTAPVAGAAVHRADRRRAGRPRPSGRRRRRAAAPAGAQLHPADPRAGRPFLPRPRTGGPAARRMAGRDQGELPALLRRVNRELAEKAMAGRSGFEAPEIACWL
ncbi:MAG: hypothetical protein AVDCRST_MAG66-814, partial [uncultured Pseudonocardia sp.]